MKTISIPMLLIITFAGISSGGNLPPVISNIRVQQVMPPELKLVEIYYDLEDPENDTVSIMLKASSDGGTTWEVPIFSVSGDVGEAVLPGFDKYILWDAGIDFDNNYSDIMQIKIAVYDYQLEMITVPSGQFYMGNSQQGPVHLVQLTHSFELSKFKMTNLEFMDMLQWAYDNNLIAANADTVWDITSGMTIIGLDYAVPYCEIGFLQGEFYLRESPLDLATEAYPNGYDPYNFPVLHVSWYGAALFCNWLSLCAGLQPAYNPETWHCGPENNPYEAEGYRLPTEAEWEYAAQYPDGRIYPWGGGFYSPDYCNTQMSIGWTSAYETYSPQGDSELGFCDLSGNLFEWINDWKSLYPNYSVINPVGASWPTGFKIIRAGSWDCDPYYVQCQARAWDPPQALDYTCSLRVARTIED